ncbi:MAG: glycerophosphodiester phosphodiesterase family protein [Candidatus Methylomirabilales bacterium]
MRCRWTSALLLLPLSLLLLAGPRELAGQQANQTSRVPTFDVQGHRGARGLVPENTLPAFERAMQLRVNTLELDLHFTRDQQVVVIHDPTLTAGKCRKVAADVPDLPVAIAGLSLKDLKRGYVCDVKQKEFPKQDPAFRGEIAGADYTVPTLQEVFDLVAAFGRTADAPYARRVRFNAETKRVPFDPQHIGDDGQAFERAIVRLIEQNGLADRVTIQSFDHRSALRVHQLSPAIETVVLTSTGNPIRPDLLAKEAQAAAWSPTFRFVDRDLVERAHRGGVRVIPWTVNDEASMRALIQMGVDGIITDVPDVLIDLLRREFPSLRPPSP